MYTHTAWTQTAAVNHNWYHLSDKCLKRKSQPMCNRAQIHEKHYTISKKKKIQMCIFCIILLCALWTFSFRPEDIIVNSLSLTHKSLGVLQIFSGSDSRLQVVPHHTQWAVLSWISPGAMVDETVTQGWIEPTRAIVQCSLDTNVLIQAIQQSDRCWHAYRNEHGALIRG